MFEYFAGSSLSRRAILVIRLSRRVDSSGSLSLRSARMFLKVSPIRGIAGVDAPEPISVARLIDLERMPWTKCRASEAFTSRLVAPLCKIKRDVGDSSCTSEGASSGIFIALSDMVCSL